MIATKVEFEDLIGVPYLLQGFDPAVGLDCLGLMIVIFRRLGFLLELPEFDYREDWRDLCDAYLARHGAKCFVKIEKPKQIGDLVLFRTEESNGQHVAVLVKPTKLIHTSERLGVHLISSAVAAKSHGVYRYAHR